MVLNSLLFKEVWKNETRGHGRIFAGAKRKQQKYVRQLQCQEQRVLIISHITFWDCGVHIFPGNLSRNSCITINIAYSLTWPASVQFYGNKRNLYTRKESFSLRICLEQQFGRRFIVPFSLNRILFYFVSFLVTLIVCFGTEIFMSKVKSIKLLLYCFGTPKWPSWRHVNTLSGTFCLDFV